MAGADYILGLLIIITGLAISDMIVSLHNLLMNRRAVRWHWLPIVSAAIVLMLIIDSWRITYIGFRDVESGPPIWAFLLILALLVPLYLAARAALPDRAESEAGIDLAEHYNVVRRYLWGAVGCTLGLFVALQLIGFFTLGIREFQLQTVRAAIGLALVLLLAFTKRAAVHRVVVPVLLIGLAVVILPARLLQL